MPRDEEIELRRRAGDDEDDDDDDRGKGRYDDEDDDEEEENEDELIAEMREILEREMKGAAQYPDVIGDLRILRTLRKHNGDFEVATEDYRSFLSLRYKHSMDDIRQQIEGKPYHMLSLPHGEDVAKYMNWNLDAGSTPHGDIVHFYGKSDPLGAVEDIGHDKLMEFFKGVFEMSSKMIEERSAEFGDVVKIVVIVDFREHKNCKEMYGWYHPDVMPLCEAMLPDSVRAVYCLNVDDYLNGLDVLEEAMNHLGIGVPGFGNVEVWTENREFLNNERLLSDLDVGVLQSAIVSCLDGLKPARDTVAVPRWDWNLRAIPIEKGKEVSWDVSVSPTSLRDATILLGCNLYMSPGKHEGIYKKVIVEDRMFSESDGMLCGEFCAQDDGILVIRYSNHHSWFRSKTIKYNVEERIVGQEVDTRDGKPAPTIDEVEMFPTGAESDVESDVGLE